MSKKSSSLFALLTVCLLVIQTEEARSQTSDINFGESNNGLSGAVQKGAGIDQLDTITFDLSQAVCSNGEVTFPVSITSDDVIWALDFSLQWDLSKSTYNSVISHKPYIQPTANYNSSDSTLRFSSFSLMPMEHNVSLVSVKLNLIAGQINAADLNIVGVLLNGSACSYTVIDGPPETNLSVVGDVNILPGDTTTLVATSTSPGCTYQWSTGSGSNLIFVTTPGTYVVTVSNSNGCSSTDFATISLANPLPVELLRFTGNQINNIVRLEWSTGSEINNSHFEVFRTTDLVERVHIGNVPGNGSASTTNEYYIIDNNPVPGIVYYILEQFDMNGTVTSYPPVVIDVIGTNEFSFENMKLYPNPVRGEEIRIIVSGLEDDVVWMLQNTAGRILEVSGFRKLSGDHTSMKILLKLPSGLPAGVYMITGSDQRNRFTAGFVVD